MFVGRIGGYLDYRYSPKNVQYAIFLGIQAHTKQIFVLTFLESAFRNILAFVAACIVIIARDMFANQIQNNDPNKQTYLKKRK